MTAWGRLQTKKRRGVIVVFVAVLMITLLGMVAFALDYGFLLKVQTDLQRSADAAALAALQDLIPQPNGTQDLDAVSAAVRSYAAENTDASFEVLDADITIGRIDPATVYSTPTILDTGVFDTVQVTLRRDRQANAPVALFFAPVLGIRDSGVTATATAVLQRATRLLPGDAIIPICIPLEVWTARNPGDIWSVYGDGRIVESSGNEIPGNWGTVDIGSMNNSTSDMRDQILNGLHQSHLDHLLDDGRIPTSTHIDCTQPMWVNADTGISSGIKAAIQAVHTKRRLMPVYDTLNGTMAGNNLEFRVIKWGVITVVDSQWHGNNNTFVLIEKSYTYDGHLRPQRDLSNTVGTVEGAFTSPALIE
jgi:Flp pilus assembly protein TadG